MISSGSLTFGAAPAQARLGHLEVAARRRAAAAHADAGRLHVEEGTALMLAQHAGDVVVDHDHLVDMVLPLRREHADGRRAAAHPHALLERAVHDRRPVGLNHDRRAAVDGEFDGLAIAQRQQRVAGDDALLLAAAREMMDAAQRQHLRAVLGRGDVAHRLALHPHRRLLGPQVAVGVDLHLDAAVAEDPLGHDRDHVDAVMLRGDDEGRGLVVGIGGGGADAGDEGALALPQFAAPGVAALDEGDAGEIGLGQQHQRIDPHQRAVLVGVAVAGAGAAGADAAQDGTGIAAHDAGAAFGLRERDVVAHARVPFQGDDGLAQAMRQQRNAVRAHAGRVMDRAQDGRRRRHQGRFADSLGAGGTQRLAILDQDALDLGHIAHGRDEIVVQVLGAAGQDIPPSARDPAPAPRRPGSGLRPGSG